MDLYTLTDTFLAKDVVDEYVSAIWTERYSVAGDVQLVVPATSETIEKLKEGTFLALRGSKEVMQIETLSIENNALTVVGNTLPEFLNQRLAWFRNQDSSPDPPEARVADFTADDMPPGEFISQIVDLMVINPSPFVGATTWALANLNWDYEIIPHLSLGDVDTSGPDKKLTATVGPLYDTISQIAEKEGVGISLYLESADPVDGYVLKFKTYRGVDHSTGGAGELVRLVPEMDSLSDVKEVRSIHGYKNVCYVYYKGQVYKYLAEPELPEPEGFDRRVLVTDPEAEPPGHKVTATRPWQIGGGTYSFTVVSPEDVTAFLDQNARDALANHNYIQAIDGQTSPNNDYQYGVHYGLGDIIELEGITGNISKARVSEFIRSEDQQGEKQYPTISVITPEPDAG